MHTTPHIKLDIDFVRDQFPAFSEPSLEGYANFENAGGSYSCRQVIDLLHRFYTSMKMQPYGSVPPSIEAGELMDTARIRLADYLHVKDHEVHIGPSTSQNTFVLADAFRKVLKAGDEIIVTDQDHESNSGVWRRLADEGFTVKEWKVDPETGVLASDDLDVLLTEQTRLVCFPHCSNIVAYLNPVNTYIEKIHRAGALAVVDGVSYAGHGFPDLSKLQADIYFFSLYKTYGPHQGAMMIREAVADHLGNQGHFFNEAYKEKHFVPAGPDHAQVVATNGVLDYFDAVFDHHFGGSITDPENRPDKSTAVHDLFRAQETALLKDLINYICSRNDLRLLGTTKPKQRAPTVAVIPKNIDPKVLSSQLAEEKIISGAGHFYAYRLLKAMNIDTDSGVIRFSFVHYTNQAEIDQLIQALDRLLN